MRFIDLCNDVFVISCVLCPGPSPEGTFLFAEVHPLVASYGRVGSFTEINSSHLFRCENIFILPSLLTDSCSGYIVLD